MGKANAVRQEIGRGLATILKIVLLIIASAFLSLWSICGSLHSIVLGALFIWIAGLSVLAIPVALIIAIVRAIRAVPSPEELPDPSALPVKSLPSYTAPSDDLP